MELEEKIRNWQIV